MGRPRVEPCAIGFSGLIGSGKTTVSQAVADALQWPRASFGDFVRSVARNQGIEVESREALQEIGISLILKGWPTFCRNVLVAASWLPGSPIVVDGIRHAEAVHHLSELVAPLPFVLIHVTVKEEVRNVRLNQRDGGPAPIAVELHSTETAVIELLPQMADLIVDSTGTLDSTCAEIIAHFANGRH